MHTPLTPIPSIYYSVSNTCHIYTSCEDGTPRRCAGLRLWVWDDDYGESQRRSLYLNSTSQILLTMNHRHTDLLPMSYRIRSQMGTFLPTSDRDTVLRSADRVLRGHGGPSLRSCAEGRSRHKRARVWRRISRNTPSPCLTRITPTSVFYSSFSRLFSRD